MARVAITAGIAIAGSNAVHAAVWNESAQASLRAGYDDNPRSLIDQSQATSYGGADLSLHLAFEKQTLSWSLDPRGVVTKYDQHHELNRTEVYVNSTLQSQRETGKTTLAFNWTRDTTLTSELGLTGFAEVNKPHQATSLTLSNLQQWTELIDSQGLLFASVNKYSDAQYTGLVNYNYGAAQLSIGYTPTMRTRWSLDTSIGKLQVPDQSRFDKTDQSIKLSYSITFADRWQAKASAGPSRVKSTSSAESGTVYEASLSRKSETSVLQLKLSRDIEPTGQGTLTRRQLVTLSASRDLSERLSASINGSYIKNDSLQLSNDVVFFGVRYTDTSLSVSWKWTPQLTLSVNAGHTEQRLQGSERTAPRNYASLGIVWSGLNHTVH